MGFFSNIINSIKKTLGIGQPKQLGSVIVKPSEVSQISKGTPYSVPETGVTGVGGGASKQGTPFSIPTGNIQEELKSGSTGANVQPSGESVPTSPTTQISSNQTNISGRTGSPQVNQTIQTPKGTGNVTQSNPDGSYSYQTEDGSSYYVDPTGKESPMYSGGAMPITPEDIVTAVTLATGIGALVKLTIKGVVSGLSAKATDIMATRAIETAAKGGGITTIRTTTNLATGTVQRVAVNTVTAKNTLSLIQKAGALFGKSKAAIGAAMAIGGSYVFSGFIEEEASQALGFAFTTAIKEGDLEGAQAILDLDKEIYDDGFIASIPVINSIEAVQDWYKANKLSRETKQKQVDRLKQGLLTPAEFEAAKKQEEKEKKEMEIYGRLDPETGEYILSPTELAKRKESEEYYAGLKEEKEGSYNSEGVWVPSKYEPASTLGFGLLKTGSITTPSKKIDPKTITLEEFNGLSKDELALLSQTEIAAIKKRLGI